ncbi:unnamed protein product [Cochlearia groenlandica]
MGLKDIGSKLPPGFRFHPSDEELVCHYLCNKIRAKSEQDVVEDDEIDESLKNSTDLVEIDLHICEPWQLPDVAKLNAKEWYFFSFRDRKYATGYRTNRATISGYWKATGKDRTVMDTRTSQLVGMRKTLVFYRNRAPNGIKTTWIMHEFRLECPNMPPKEDWVLCRVFNKELMKQPTRTTNNHQTIPCGWEQIMSSSSSHGPSHESLLKLLYTNNVNINDDDGHDQDYNYEKMMVLSEITSLDHDKTYNMGSSSDGGTVSDLHMDQCGGFSFENGDLLDFH